MAHKVTLFVVLVFTVFYGHALGSRLGRPDRILVNIPESPWLDVSNEVATYNVDDANLIGHIPESPWMEVSKNTWSQASAREGSAHDFSEEPHILKTPWSQVLARDFSKKPHIPETPWGNMA